MPRFAALDVGSNALRLRVIDAAGAHGGAQLPLLKGDANAAAWQEVVSQRASVRLGGEVFSTGKLAPQTIGLACAALRDFRRAMDDAKVVAYRAVATSAVREAENAATLVERARREAGIELEVIEGVEEARLIQLAVVRRLKLDGKRTLLIDVGGGSTELTVLEKGRSAFSVSLPLGTVRLLETLLHGAQTIDKKSVALLSEQIERSLSEARGPLARATLDFVIGTGGCVDTLADLCAKKGGFGGHPRAIDVPAAKALLGKLCAMTPNERKDAYGLRADRADTIVPATAIFVRIAESLSAPAIVAPGVGLKEGILEEVVDKYFHVWDEAGEASAVLQACVSLGRRYQFDEAHGERVAKFAAQLFDDLRSTHGLGDRQRLLLRAAGMLHDIGDFVRYDGHHKHSQYLIEHADIMGLLPGERSIVACVARYHRKSLPDPAHLGFRELDKDARSTVRALASILRIADALDREHLGKVEGVRAMSDSAKRKVTIAIEGTADRELEEWTLRAKADLFRETFGVEIAIAK